MDRENVKNIIISQLLSAKPQLCPHNQKMSFLLTVEPGKYVDTVSKVRSLMAAIGIAIYELNQLDFDTIYHAHFTNYVEIEERRQR